MLFNTKGSGGKMRHRYNEFFYLPIQDSWSQFEGKKIKSLSEEWVKKTGIPQPGDIQKIVP